MSDHSTFVSDLSQKIDGMLRDLVPAGTRVALIDFPNHSNVGDSAIWLGARASLQRLGARLVYACDIEGYKRQDLAGVLEEGIILLNGGGNLGDIWPTHQPFREKVLADFQRTRVIQLPQSINFQNPANLARAQACFNSHPAFTLMVRDQQSLEQAQRDFIVPTLLCPDMSLAMGPIAPPGAPQVDVLWLARADREATGLPAANAPGVKCTDWITSQVLTEPSPDKRAAWQVTRGTQILSQGKVVISDRLHGHLLALMMGVPHVVLDNNYGKVRSFFETWTSGCGLAHWADSPSQALEQAKGLLRVGPAAP